LASAKPFPFGHGWAQMGTVPKLCPK